MNALVIYLGCELRNFIEFSINFAPVVVVFPVFHRLFDVRNFYAVISEGVFPIIFSIFEGKKSR